jgi:hypothetical protein
MYRQVCAMADTVAREFSPARTGNMSHHVQMREPVVRHQVRWRVKEFVYRRPHTSEPTASASCRRRVASSISSVSSFVVGGHFWAAPAPASEMASEGRLRSAEHSRCSGIGYVGACTGEAGAHIHTWLGHHRKLQTARKHAACKHAHAPSPPPGPISPNRGVRRGPQRLGGGVTLRSKTANPQ